MEKKYMRLINLAGLAAVITMFTGDMLLYFTTQPIAHIETELIAIMGGVSDFRLILGSMLGALAVVFYCIGFLQFYFAIQAEKKTMKTIIYLLMCSAMVFGGVFHCYFYAMGMSSKLGLDAFTDNLFHYMHFYFFVFLALMLAATIMFIVLILKGKTVYPKWMVFLLPMVLFFLSEPAKSLPQPLLIVISGGWFNVMYLPFFILSPWYLRTRLTELDTIV